MPRSPRILMISTHGYVAAQPPLGKPDTGGQVVYVLELSKSLARQGYQVDILTRQFDDMPMEESVAHGVRILRQPCGPQGFVGKEWLFEYIPELVNRSLEFFRKHDLKYQFINSHYWDAGLAGQSIADRLHVPHIHTPHSLGAWKRRQTEGTPEGLEKQFNFERRIREERELFLDADLVTATTPEQKRLITGEDYEVPPKRVAILPAGFDGERFRPIEESQRQRIRQRLGWEGKIILALGRLAENKGYDLLLRALPTVLQRVPEAKVLLAAGAHNPPPRERAMLEEFHALAAELGIRDKVLFRDFIPDEELVDYYGAADSFALCSRYEPFGMTAVEAMACGTPTVVTTRGGLCESIVWGRDALTADPEDPIEYGVTLSQILSQPKLASRLSRHGARTAQAKYTWSHVARKLVELVPRGVVVPQANGQARRPLLAR